MLKLQSHHPANETNLVLMTVVLLSSMQKKGVQGAQTDSLRPLTRKQRLLHALFFVILPWLMARGERIMARRQWGARPSGDWRRSFWLAVERSQAAVQVLSTANLLLFLRFGRYYLLVALSRGVPLVPWRASSASSAS